MTISQLEQLGQAVAPYIDAAVAKNAAELARTNEPVSQRDSIAGPRRHIRICRALVSEGSADAWIVGRTYYVRRGRLEQELSGFVADRDATPEPGEAEPMLDELGLEVSK